MTESPAWRSYVTVVIAHSREPLIWFHSGIGPTLRLDLDGYVWFPDVSPVLTQMRSRWKIDAIVIRSLDFRYDKDERQCWLTFLVQPRTEEMPEDGRWLPITEVDPSDEAENNTWRLVAAALRDPTDPASRTRRPWAERGWYEEAVAWVEGALPAGGLELTAPPEQLRTWGLSTVIRFGTSTGDAYFKAAVYTGPGSAEDDRGPSFLFANEAALLSGLTARFPDHLPAPIAVDPERVWMLLPHAGSFLADCRDLDVWEQAIRLHARHQRAYVGHAADLHQIGCLDRRLDRLASQVKTLLPDDDILAYLDESDREQLRAAAPRFRARIAELADLGVPATLVHGDLHANNIGVRHGRPIYFDWTDGCVAHPFLDLVTFTGESDFLDATPGARDRLYAAYLDEWRDLVPAPALARAAQLIEPVGALHQAVSYQHMLPGLDEPDRSSMGRGGAFWLKMAIKHVGADASS